MKDGGGGMENKTLTPGDWQPPHSCRFFFGEPGGGGKGRMGRMLSLSFSRLGGNVEG